MSVIVGTADETFDADALRRTARKARADVLIGLHGNRLIVVVGRIDSGMSDSRQRSLREISEALEPHFGAGAMVIGPEVQDVTQANLSAKAAVAGFTVVKSWPKNSRPVVADDLLAERALAGDMLAKSTLVQRVYRPLRLASPELLETLRTYLDSGRSLESTARELFVHANTVRYRLKKISELIGWDATGSREAFILQVAMVLGSMTETD